MKKQGQEPQDGKTQRKDAKISVGSDTGHEDWKAKYIRALADYQNLEKRVFAQTDSIRKYASEQCINRFLPVVDALEQLRTHIKDEGLEIVWKQMTDVLGGEGVVRIDAIGKLFDPYSMECIEIVEGDDGVVINETQAGYRLHDKVIRPARVKVGKRTIVSPDTQRIKN